MNTRKMLIVLIVVLGLGPSAWCFDFHPCLSLLGSYTTTRNYTDIRSGAFDIRNRKLNFGFEFTNKFSMPGNYFIRTGFRYNQYRVTIAGENPVVASLAGKPYPLLWQRGYESFAIPVQIGKDFTTHRGNKGDLYIGFSAGIIATSFAKDEVSSSAPANSNTNDIISSTIGDKSDPIVSSFFPTLDLGANYQPFKAIPAFTMGIFYSVQINKTAPSTYTGVVRNETKGQEFSYDLQHQQRVTNYTISLSYTFGKQKPATQKKNSTDCPQ